MKRKKPERFTTTSRNGETSDITHKQRYALFTGPHLGLMAGWVCVQSRTTLKWYRLNTRERLIQQQHNIFKIVVYRIRHAFTHDIILVSWFLFRCLSFIFLRLSSAYQTTQAAFVLSCERECEQKKKKTQESNSKVLDFWEWWKFLLISKRYYLNVSNQSKWNVINENEPHRTTSWQTATSWLQSNNNKMDELILSIEWVNNRSEIIGKFGDTSLFCEWDRKYNFWAADGKVL